jgi:hypothetical protein
MPHDRYEDRRTFNVLTGHQRTPWSALDTRQRQVRYAQAVRAFDNGVLKKHPGRFAQFARAQESLDAHKKKPRKKQSLSSKTARMPLPWVFRRGGCDRVLICLALNGPMTVRELSRAIESDSHKTFDMVERLRKSGLVVKRDHGGGRKYVALNRQLPIYRSLHRLLLALDKHWPAKRINTVARWHMPFDRALTTQRMDNIFQSPARSRILLFISAVGETDMTTMYKLMGLGSVSTMYIVNHWEKQGIVRTRWFKRHRLVRLNPKFIVAKELKALLREIIVHLSEYRTLRKIARARLRKTLKAANSK